MDTPGYQGPLPVSIVHTEDVPLAGRGGHAIPGYSGHVPGKGPEGANMGKRFAAANEHGFRSLRGEPSQAQASNHRKGRDPHGNIPGYSGHIPGKLEDSFGATWHSVNLRLASADSKVPMSTPRAEVRPGEWARSERRPLAPEAAEGSAMLRPGTGQAASAVPGYSGHVPGKLSENIVGARCAAANAIAATTEPGTIKWQRTAAPGVDVQQAFVRMGGSRHACHMMMLRLNDEQIVTHVVRLLAAGVENAPLAAEALQRDNLDNVKLIMRSMERHLASAEVSEAGCLLIGHLCSGTAAQSGDLKPVRVKAHRDCQNSLCREGAMETIVDILTLHMKEVRRSANRAHMMMQEKLKEAEIKRQRQEEVDLGLVRERAPVNGGFGGFSKMGLKDRIMKVQANLELRGAWQTLVDKEVMGGRVMNAALQALLLLVVGNSGALRQLSGNFFAYHMNKLLDMGEEFLDAAKEAKAEKDMRRGRGQRTSTGEESESDTGEDGKKPPRMRNKMGRVEVPVGQERQAMGSLESLSLKCQVLVDALRGHAAKDRPAIAIKACRLCLLIFEHHKANVQKANDQGRNRCRHVELKLRHTVVEEDRQFEEVFKHLASMKTALIGTLRTHNENSAVISAVFSVLANLRELALLSAPAGMPVAGSAVEKHWQAALVKAGGEDTEWIIRQAALRLRRALEETKKGDHRIETQNIRPQDLRGNGEWLTPRLREEVRNMLEVAEGLGADAFKARWADAEEPDRWNVIYRKQQQLAAQAKYREDKIKAKELGITYEEFHRRELEEIARREAEEDESSSSGISGFTARTAEDVGEVVVATEEELNFEEEDVFGLQQWVRAIGFGQHEEEDFDRVWRKPVTDALMRALPARAPPGSVWAIEAAQRRREIIEQAEKSGEPLEDPDMDELLQIEMLESLQGKLKIRALVRAQDQIQTNIIEGKDAKGNELDPRETSKSIIQEVAKGFKKQGYMVPKYGFSVRLQKRAMSMTQLAQEAAAQQ